MTTARRLHYTYSDYLRAQELSELRLEYCEGEIYAMAGGTPEHGALAAQLTVLLGASLKGDCRVLSSDVKVRIAPTDLTTYPDLSIVCGKLERAPQDPNAVVNPILVAEVTSPSTEDYDRGEKLSHYKQLPSLRAILLVAHSGKRVTLVQREGPGWSVQEHRSGELVRLAVPDLTLAVDDLYKSLAGL